MIEVMAVIHMSETEAARDFHAVLAQVQQGAEIVIEQDDHRPVAVIKSANRGGRPIVDILREAKQRKLAVTLDEDFGNDLEAIIAGHQQPWNPPSWD
jgi:antitoxin (DNA-binding transcriptional repressor) of toxin-antitoxin stability system